MQQFLPKLIGAAVIVGIGCVIAFGPFFALRLIYKKRGGAPWNVASWVVGVVWSLPAGFVVMRLGLETLGVR